MRVGKKKYLVVFLRSNGKIDMGWMVRAKMEIWARGVKIGKGLCCNETGKDRAEVTGSPSP